MKYTIIISLLLINSVVRSQPFNLTVNNGIGSNVYNEGDTVHIWSNAIFGDSVFVDWAGTDSSYLTHNNEWHTTLIIPVNTNIGSIIINANYDVIPFSTQIDSTSYLLFGENNGTQSNITKECIYAIPPSPKGIVFLFHGTGGSGKSFFHKYENYNLIKDLVFDGYAVFTLDANEVTMGDQDGNGKLRWIASNAATANPENNIDILNIQTLKDSVINEFNFSLNIPCFSLGMSNGAVFSDICASALNFNASAHVTAKGNPDTYTRPDIVPIIWVMSDNDHNDSADNAAAFNNYLIMNTTQTAEWYLLKPSPLYSKRFLRSLNIISEEQSDSVFQRLLTNGFLDDDNFLSVLDINLIPINLLDDLDFSLNQKLDIRRQLLIVNADHVLHSDFNKNIIRFFNQTLSTSTINDNGIDADTYQLNYKIYPNPFNPITTIRFDIPLEVSYTSSLQIYNITGHLVESLFNEIFKPGIHEIQWNASKHSSGIYFAKLTVGNQVKTQKLVFVK
ncbi:MAG: T9SS type A sorting domain-containing protein [Candidatus Marinimicrobia bacterium]|nr:T9SS type A sorting domain-containing protein [Candidatus Neomarinimicrobiota bacterium]